MVDETPKDWNYLLDLAEDYLAEDFGSQCCLLAAYPIESFKDKLFCIYLNDPLELLKPPMRGVTDLKLKLQPLGSYSDLYDDTYGGDLGWMIGLFEWVSWVVSTNSDPWQNKIPLTAEPLYISEDLKPMIKMAKEFSIDGLSTNKGGRLFNELRDRVALYFRSLL